MTPTVGWTKMDAITATPLTTARPTPEFRTPSSSSTMLGTITLPSPYWMVRIPSQ